MKCDLCGASMIKREVTYTLEMDGKFIVVEHVPAKVCPQCGEKLFSPETVERLQKTIWEQKEPVRVMQTPVFDFASGSVA